MCSVDISKQLCPLTSVHNLLTLQSTTAISHYSWLWRGNDWVTQPLFSSPFEWLALSVINLQIGAFHSRHCPQSTVHSISAWMYYKQPSTLYFSPLRFQSNTSISFIISRSLRLIGSSFSSIEFQFSFALFPPSQSTPPDSTDRDGIRHCSTLTANRYY